MISIFINIQKIQKVRNVKPIKTFDIPIEAHTFCGLSKTRSSTRNNFFSDHPQAEIFIGVLVVTSSRTQPMDHFGISLLGSGAKA